MKVYRFHCAPFMIYDLELSSKTCNIALLTEALAESIQESSENMSLLW